MANEILDTTWTSLNIAFSLTDGKTYRFQNIGTDDLIMIEAASEPDLGSVGFIYKPGQPDILESIVVGTGLTWWARSSNSKTIITINEAV